MPGTKADQLYERGTQRWPSVAWPQTAYQAHLDGDSPPHPADLYLGGAAGHRISAAWEVIQTELGPPAKRILSGQPSADFTLDDLWAQAVSQLIDNDSKHSPLADGRQPAKIIRYRGLVSLLNYFVVVAKRLAIQQNRRNRSRPTLSLTGSDDDAHTEPPPAPGRATASPEEHISAQETADRMKHCVGKAYAKLSGQQQFLIAMVYRQGMLQKDAGAMLNWSAFKTTRQLKAAMAIMRDAMTDLAEELPGLDWTPALAAAWEGCWAEAWADVQVPPVGASKKQEARRKGAGV